MARKISFDRNQAIETVMNEIWLKGYESCSVKSIAEKLGITRSSFYNSFASREQIFLEALEHYSKQSPDTLLNTLNVVNSPLELITSVFKLAVERRTSDPMARGCMTLNSVNELVGVHDSLGPKLEEALLGCIDRIEALLQRSVALKELPEDTDTRNLALALQNLLMGTNLLSKVIKDKDELWSATKTTLEALKLCREPSEKTCLNNAPGEDLTNSVK